MDEHVDAQTPTLASIRSNTDLTDLTDENTRVIIIVKYPTTGQDIEMPLYTERPSK